MSDGNGLAVVKHVKDNLLSSPVIMITSYGDKELAVKMINLHIYGFIEKPYISKDVLAVVERGLDKKDNDEQMKTFAKIGEKTSEMLHDISNPLTIIELEAQELKDNNNDSATSESKDKVNTLADSMLKHSNRIKNLVKSTKDLLKNSKKNPNANFKTIEFNSLLADLKSACVAQAEQFKVPVIVNVAKDLTIQGDKDELLRAFINLVNNSIEAVANLDEKWVLVNAHFNKKNLEITITDSGKGIPAPQRDKIFNSLFTTKPAGTGLGLKIVSDIIKGHQGQVYLNATSPNTEFVIVLPRK